MSNWTIIVLLLQVVVLMSPIVENYSNSSNKSIDKKEQQLVGDRHIRRKGATTCWRRTHYQKQINNPLKTDTLEKNE